MYSNPKCPKCGHESFESTAKPITGINGVLMFIMCSSCNTTISVMDNTNMSKNFESINKDLEFLKEQIKRIPKNPK